LGIWPWGRCVNLTHIPKINTFKDSSVVVKIVGFFYFNNKIKILIVHPSLSYHFLPPRFDRPLPNWEFFFFLNPILDFFIDLAFPLLFRPNLSPALLFRPFGSGIFNLLINLLENKGMVD
jgi:hypothetical protein